MSVSIEDRMAALIDALRGRALAVLTGAGVSTASGIPDYRGPDGQWRRDSRPVQYRDFVASESTRRRYWARSSVGWPWFRARQANDVHYAVAALSEHGRSCEVITQNVDGLHTAAGSTRVIELHGSLAEVVCLDCGQREGRDALQDRMMRGNPGWQGFAAEMAPDGDAELDDEAVAGFHHPACIACGGVIKPDVVFFGESVPGVRVDEARAAIDSAELLLVLGSSLAVYSGYRFVRHAVEVNTPVYCVNRGATRADVEFVMKIDGPLQAFSAALLGIKQAESSKL